MALKKQSYANVRSLMQPGDLIAFGGTDVVADVIKWSTESVVSHVGVILQTKILIDQTPGSGMFNNIVESTILRDRNGKVNNGVQIHRLSYRLQNSEIRDGNVWWLPLSDAIRKKMNIQKFFDWIMFHKGRPYDVPQAIRSDLDLLDEVPWLRHLTLNQEDFSSFFCSELVAGAYKQSGILPKKLNASEITPSNLVSLKLFAKDYVQIKGKLRKIDEFNQVDPLKAKF